MSQDRYTFSRNPAGDTAAHPTGKPNPEANLAYLLQHGAPGDPALLEVLFERYGADLYRLASALNAGSDPAASQDAPSRIPLVTRQVLLHAVRHPDQFWGQEGVREWLYGLVLARWYGRRRLKVLCKALVSADGQPAPNTTDSGALTTDTLAGKPQELAALRALPEAHRLVLILRYGHGLSLRQILACLEDPANGQLTLEALHLALTSARRSLSPALGLELPGDCSGWAQDPPPSMRLQQHLDDLLAQDPYASAALIAHQAECPACKAESRAWEAAAARLTRTLREAWPGPSAPERQGMLEDLRARLASGPQTRLQLPWRMVSLAVLLLAALGVIALVFQRTETAMPPPVSEADLAVIPTAESGRRAARPAAPALPTPIPLPGASHPERFSTYAGPNVVWSGTPVLSGDGRLLAFSSLADYWVENDSNAVTDIFVYDLQNDRVERISERDGRQAMAPSSSPTISADGRYVAYLTQAASLLGDSVNWDYCSADGRTRSGTYVCQDVVLFDRETGLTTWVTRGDDGSFANAYHANPALSADGSSLVFFSTSQHLAGLRPDSPASACPAEAVLTSWQTLCGDLYVYDIPTGALERIPLGRLPGAERLNRALEPAASISRDGRFVSFTIARQDYVNFRGLGPDRRAGEPILLTEAYVFDRQERTYLPLDRTPGEGEFPDAPSYFPALSADGRFAAFVSEANNLIPQDANGLPDVYLRDLASGSLELISRDASGRPGDGPSGVFLIDREHHNERLNLSADGRYVAFVSAAPNLIQNGLGADSLADLCWSWENGEICSGLYLHDRETGETRLVDAARNNFVFHDPGLAGDGSLLAYSDDRFNCEGGYPYQICADLWLYNITTGESLALSEQYALNVQPGERSRRLAQVLQDEDIYQTSDLSGPLDLPPLDGPVQEFPEAHIGRLTTLDISPDGSLLATGGDDDRVLLRDATTLEIVDRLTEYDERVSAVRFSPAGDWLGTGSRDGTIRIWRVDELAQNFPRRAYSMLRSVRIGSVLALDFSPDDRWLAVGSSSGLWIWEREGRTFNLRDDLSITGPTVPSVDFSPALPQINGSLLAAGLQDGTTLLVQMPTGRVQARLGGHNEDVLSVAFSPGGDLVATGGRDGAVDVWRINPGRPSLAPEHLSRAEHSDWVTSLAFSPSGETLVTGAFGLALRYVDAATGQIVDHNSEIHRRNVIAVRPNADGTRLYAGTGTGMLLVFSEPVVSEPKYFQVISPESGQGAFDPPDTPFYASAAVPSLPASDDDFSHLWMMPAHLLDDLPPDRLEQMYVPTNLPEHLRLVAFYVLQSSDEAPIQYYAGDEGAINGVLILRQGDLASSTVFNWRISPQAAVRQVPFDFLPAVQSEGSSQVQAELVLGGWKGGPFEIQSPLQWDPQLPMATLRWTAGGTGFMLQYLLIGDQEPGKFRLEDLVETARSMRAYTSLASVEPIEVPFRTQAGQTCTGLAEQFGTSVVNLIRINRAAYQYLSTIGCESLDSGIEIVVPVAPEPYLSRDLDCDGLDERLQLLPNPFGGLFGFLLQVLDGSGLYTAQALVRFEDSAQQVMQPPMLLQQPDRCGQLVAVQVDETSLPAPRLRLLSWDGEHLNTVLDGQGQLVNLGLQGDQVVARSQWLQPGEAESCTLTQAVYVQVGDRFEQFATEILGEAPCQTDPLAAGQSLPDAPPGMLNLADLDCDENPEWLRAEPRPGASPGEYSALQVLRWGQAGSPEVLATYTPPGDRPGWFGAFSVLAGGDASSSPPEAGGETCWRLIALPEMDFAGQVTAQVFLTWDGAQLVEAGRLPGRLINQGLYAHQGVLTMLASRQVQPGVCAPMLAPYQLEDGTLVELPVPGGETPPLCQPEAGN